MGNKEADRPAKQGCSLGQIHKAAKHAARLCIGRDSLYLDRTLNFAHRGASHEAPANTLAAFLLAAELGADGIELDVHLSRDGEIVVIHDFDLQATTDGQGPVGARTLAELKELDAGGWFDPVFAGEQIPTLQEVIDAVGDRLLLNIELKAKSSRVDRLAVAVVRAIERNHLSRRVIVSSFNPWALRWVDQLNSSIPLGLLYGPRQSWLVRLGWLRQRLRVDALHPHHSAIDARSVRWITSHGYRLHTWTVDEPGRMRQLIELGVDLIITNRPDRLRAVLSTAAANSHT